MATRRVEISGIGNVTLIKRRSSKNIRLSLLPNGEIRVSLPVWAPYQLGLAFIQKKTDWIQRNRTLRPSMLRHGQQIGKAHRLVFSPQHTAGLPTSRVVQGTVKISLPPAMPDSHPDAQRVAHAAAERALRAEARQLLPRRLNQLAALHGFTYRSVSVKRLRSRWGSCNEKQGIVLNIFLMQLPWEYIDYVLLHELVHTQHLHHGPKFWQTFERCLPEAKRLRKHMRAFQPLLRAG